MKRLKYILRSQKGFTFIETILTTVVLSVGFWAAMAVMQNVSSNSMSNDFRIMASQLASEEIETVIADKSFRGFDYVVQANYSSEALTGAYQGFTRNVTVTEVNASDLATPEAGSGYKKVDVTVTWGQNGNETIAVSTILTDYT